MRRYIRPTEARRSRPLVCPTKKAGSPSRKARASKNGALSCSRPAGATARGGARPRRPARRHRASPAGWSPCTGTHGARTRRRPYAKAKDARCPARAKPETRPCTSPARRDTEQSAHPFPSQRRCVPFLFLSRHSNRTKRVDASSRRVLPKRKPRRIWTLRFRTAFSPFRAARASRTSRTRRARVLPTARASRHSSSGRTSRPSPVSGL
mmetsp:Transcript_9941/g.42277  ORF Transcript_9941/g.42277 Transcript_9941/m.42277 type:complete len:209 (-) Transcript_9941:869-1495(-)